MRVMTVVGARPQFIKCAAVSRVLRQSHEELLVHTGQHHDHAMSELFFEQLEIPEPDINLGIAGGTHGDMTGRMLSAIEAVAMREAPEWMLVYGDTNSTLAGALVAAKLHIPVAHVEAGLRSFNRKMPEEINRVVTDHVSNLLLCPTAHAVSLLAAEGVTEGVHNVGDVMFDSVLFHRERAGKRLSLDELLIAHAVDLPEDGRYAVATIHRPENTDHPDRLASIFAGLSDCGVLVVLPLHPRTRKIIEASSELRGTLGANIRIIDPVGYLEALLLMSKASVVLTDSGGMQKEAFFLGVRCVTMRDETEWVETVEAGANVVVGADRARIAAEASQAMDLGTLPPPAGIGPFGDGHAAEAIVRTLEGGAVAH